MTERYEIVPGKSIGPFKLGMTRAEIEALNIRPMEVFQDEAGAAFAAQGVNVKYDDSGTCRQIKACVFGSGTAGIEFSLAGRCVNGIAEREAQELFGCISSDIRYFYGGFALPSAGLKALKWEAGDEFIFAILVEQPR